MGKKRTLNRMDYRGDFEEEGAEATKAEDEEKDEDEEGDEDEEEAEADVEVDAEAEDGGDDDEDAPKPKKKKKVAAAVKPKRTRAAKVVRRKAVWRIFDNSSKLIETFEYNQRADAEALLEQKNTDKKGFYIQLVKVELDEKDKEKETEKPKSRK